MPIAFTVGGDDAIVPPDSVVRLEASLKKLGRKVMMINRFHGGHSTNHEDAMAALAFMVESVKQQ